MTAFPGFIDLQSGVDKTEAVAQWLEEGAWQLIFRPIGFGKTAWLDLLQAYCGSRFKVAAERTVRPYFWSDSGQVCGISLRGIRQKRRRRRW